MTSFKRLVLHPFLLGIYPVIGLLATNLSQISPTYALRSLLLVPVVTGLFLLIYRVVYRDWQRSGLASTLTLVLFFTYGHVYSAIKDAMLLGLNLGRHRILVPIWIVLLALGLWLIAKKLRQTEFLTRALNITAILVLIFPLVQGGSFLVRQNNERKVMMEQGRNRASEMGLKVAEGQTPPDVYYIILDTYTRGDTLRKKFDYDNGGFLDALKERGFYVASCSQSNYGMTWLSITSSLNFTYLEDMDPAFTPPNTDVNGLYPYLYNSTARVALESMGYQTVAFETGYSPTELDNADSYLTPQSDIKKVLFLGGVNPFEAMELNTSAGLLLYEFRDYLPREVRTFLDDSYNSFRNRILFQTSELEQVASLPGPKFVFVHIMAPHDPFAFGPNGEILENYTPFNLRGAEDAYQWPDYVSGYRDEVNYLNKLVIEAVDGILANSTTPPVIILQGDHGAKGRPVEDWHLTILNAYYLPGETGKNQLYPSISPVNTFRVIFNTYFHGQLDILDDRACSSSKKDPFNCMFAPDPNPVCTPDQ